MRLVSVGVSCSFTGLQGQVDGTCVGPQGGSELVCVPERRGPPSGAVDACARSEAGAACSFDGPGGKVEGTWFAPEGGQGLVCAPRPPAPADRSGVVSWPDSATVEFSAGSE